MAEGRDEYVTSYTAAKERACAEKLLFLKPSDLISAITITNYLSQE